MVMVLQIEDNSFAVDSVNGPYPQWRFVTSQPRQLGDIYKIYMDDYGKKISSDCVSAKKEDIEL